MDFFRIAESHCRLGFLNHILREVYPPARVLQGGELTGTLPSFFAVLKTETLIYQCFFCFAQTAKNAIFSSLPLRSAYNSDKLHFNAWFMPSVGSF